MLASFPGWKVSFLVLQFLRKLLRFWRFSVASSPAMPQSSASMAAGDTCKGPKQPQELSPRSVFHKATHPSNKKNPAATWLLWRKPTPLASHTPSPNSAWITVTRTHGIESSGSCGASQGKGQKSLAAAATSNNAAAKYRTAGANHPPPRLPTAPVADMAFPLQWAIPSRSVTAVYRAPTQGCQVFLQKNPAVSFGRLPSPSRARIPHASRGSVCAPARTSGSPGRTGSGGGGSGHSHWELRHQGKSKRRFLQSGEPRALARGGKIHRKMFRLAFPDEKSDTRHGKNNEHV